ncbi:MAG: hypothetical protein M0C28_14940 [Candidatus Moduliflexus flocculans]|nr:hypothetical protein [Candidatus Moduliflexus flocculans]
MNASKLDLSRPSYEFGPNPVDRRRRPGRDAARSRRRRRARKSAVWPSRPRHGGTTDRRGHGQCPGRRGGRRLRHVLSRPPSLGEAERDASSALGIGGEALRGQKAAAALSGVVAA